MEKCKRIFMTDCLMGQYQNNIKSAVDLDKKGFVGSKFDIEIDIQTGIELVNLLYSTALSADKLMKYDVVNNICDCLDTLVKGMGEKAISFVKDNQEGLTTPQTVVE